MERNIFLIDGFGALISTVLLYVLSLYEKWFGMPANVCNWLMVITTIFTINSFISYCINLTKWEKLLKIVAIGNIFYCLITVLLLHINFKSLTKLGIAYFIGEIIIIISLSIYELRLTKTK